MAGVGCATRKDSLLLAREMCSRWGSGEGRACRRLGGSGDGRAFRLLGGAGGGVRRAVVLAVLSGRVPSRERTAKQSSLHGVYLQEE